MTTSFDVVGGLWTVGTGGGGFLDFTYAISGMFNVLNVTEGGKAEGRRFGTFCHNIVLTLMTRLFYIPLDRG